MKHTDKHNFLTILSFYENVLGIRIKKFNVKWDVEAEFGHIFIINEIMYFHVVLARSLICTLRSPQVMNGTQNRCLFLLTPFISLHETQHLTPAVGVLQRTNCSHLWFVYRKLKSVTLRTSGLSVRSFFLRSAPAVKGIWIPHGTISLTANIDPEYSEVQRSTAKRRMLTAPWQP